MGHCVQCVCMQGVQHLLRLQLQHISRNNKSMLQPLYCWQRSACLLLHIQQKLLVKGLQTAA